MPNPQTPDLTNILDALLTTFRSGGKLLVCGNGGSAADSEHVVGELMKSFELPRPLPPELKERLRGTDLAEGASLAESLELGLPAISLSSQTSLLTAIANDQGYENVFAQQVLGYGRPGDALLAFTTSGESRNVVRALITAQALGLTAIAFTGANGGAAAKYANHLVAVPATSTARVQEQHLAAYHELCAALEAAMFAPS